MIGLKYRDQLKGATLDEFEQLATGIRSLFDVEHNGDGTHSDITADSITITGPSADGNVFILDQTNIVTTGPQTFYAPASSYAIALVGRTADGVSTLILYANDGNTPLGQIQASATGMSFYSYAGTDSYLDFSSGLATLIGSLIVNAAANATLISALGGQATGNFKSADSGDVAATRWTFGRDNISTGDFVWYENNVDRMRFLTGGGFNTFARADSFWGQVYGRTADDVSTLGFYNFNGATRLGYIQSLATGLYLLNEVGTDSSLALTSGLATITGLLTVSGLGTHNFTGSGNSLQLLQAENLTSGTAAQAVMRATAGGIIGQLASYSPLFTTSTWQVASGTAVYGGGAGGLSVVADNAAGDVRIYSRGVLAATFGAAQLATLTGALTVSGRTLTLGTTALGSELTAGGTNTDLDLKAVGTGDLRLSTNAGVVLKLTAAGLAQFIASFGSIISYGGGSNITATEFRGFANSTYGASIAGYGTSYDFAVFNKSFQDAILVPTGTRNVTIGQNLTVNNTSLLSGAVNITSSLQCDSIVNDTGLASGTYTPGLVNSINISASTAFLLQYMRVGSTVTVSGRVEIDPTVAAGANTVLIMSIPVASNFANPEDAGGTFSNGAGNHGAIKADPANDAVSFVFSTGILANDSYHFTFTYRVI